MDVEFGDCLEISGKNDRFFEVETEDSDGRAVKMRVPTGAAIECHTQPPSRVGGPKIMDPNHVTGLYVTAYALVDRPTATPGEIHATKGDKFRVYARCSHWSFAIKERSNDFGWIPSWLMSSSNVNEATRREMVVTSPKRH
jgi:hypothetical protein